MSFGKEIRIEVVSISEAEEYCEANNLEFVKLYEGRGPNHGRLMMLAIDHNSTDADLDNDMIADILERHENKDTVIYCMVNNGKMYLADKKKCNSSVTFNVTQAKKFKSSDAFKKIHFMNMVGNHTWKVFRT